MIEKLNTFWSSFANDCAPEADELKNVLKERWVRFHSLPESKRYPENEQEFIEIFSRHNTVLTEIFGLPIDLFIVLPEYSGKREPTRPENILLGLYPKTDYWKTIDQSDEDEEYFTHLHAAKIHYTGSELDDLLRLVAEEKVGSVLIFTDDGKAIFHPYDGGADIIMSNADARDSLKQKHVDWLSSYPGGY